MIAQVVVEVPGGYSGGFVVLPLLVLLAPTAGLVSIEQDIFPIDLVLVFGGLVFLVPLHPILGRLDQLEERVGDQLLFQVLLQVEQGHIEEIHRLIEARIDPQLLP